MKHYDHKSTKHTTKGNCQRLQTIDLEICSILMFYKKGLCMVSPPYFVRDFLRKMFLMLYSISWPNFTAWLPLLLEILDNRCISIVFYPGWDVINFEINLYYLIKPFFYMTKKSRQKFQYLENEKNLQGKSILKCFQLSKIVADLKVHLWIHFWLFLLRIFLVASIILWFMKCSF